MGHQADAGVRGDDRLGGPSLSEDVYWQLRKEIVRGDLRPNQPLAEIDIAERLRVSRTPVRESMQRLAADGLVVSRRRRWLVYEHTKAEIEFGFSKEPDADERAADRALRRHASEKQRPDLDG